MAETPKADEFYVGYLPMPEGHLRLVRIAVPVLLWLMVLSGVGFAMVARKPGDAVWDTGKPAERVGVVHESPYPYLMPTSGDAKPVFLVEQGKHGAQSRLRGREGQLVRVTGFRLDRDGREILELEDRPVEVVAGVVPASSPARDLGPVTVSGEIVDYKCYLGAMKPGDGKTHKACAALCISGGIPAMLVSVDELGQRVYTVLVDEAGGAASLAEVAGEPVRVSGRMEEQGGLRVLRIGAGGVSRAK